MGKTSSLSSSSSSSSSFTPSPSSSSYYFPYNFAIARKGSLRSMEAHHHFLDACFFCKTPLHIGDDIYMYRGDTPFCSELCRQEQIDIDEAEERSISKMMSKDKMKSKISGAGSSKSCEPRLRSASTAVVG